MFGPSVDIDGFFGLRFRVFSRLAKFSTACFLFLFTDNSDSLYRLPGAGSFIDTYCKSRIVTGILEEIELILQLAFIIAVLTFMTAFRRLT